MKRFFTFLATFSLVEPIGRHPAISGVLMLLGVGGGATAISILTPPTITPFISSNFNPNAPIGSTTNGLLPNGGATGALAMPPGNTSGYTGSFGLYFEATVDPNLSYNNGAKEQPFAGLVLQGNMSPGQPNFSFQRVANGSVLGAQWWQYPFTGGTIPQAATTGSNYSTGFYPATLSGGGCAREPVVVWQGSTIATVDPGFNCSTAPTFSAATVPNAGAQQTGITATCAPGTSGNLNITTSVPVSPGVSPGLTYPVNFTTTGGTPANLLASATLTAVSVTGSGPYSLVGTIAGSVCPTSIATGTVNSGTGGAYAFPALSTTNPWLGAGGTGITTKNGQHICGFIGEYGDDSPFPGAQFISMVDEKGNPLPGSPAVVQTPNQGTANFTGFTTIGSPVLNVTALNPYTITSAAWALGSGPLASTGLVTFQVSSNPGFVPGSQFTVSGMSPSSVNGTYSAVTGTNSSQVVGSQLTGPGGVPQAFANPGAITVASTPQMVSVIFPGMVVLGTSGFPSLILPYLTGGTSGTGGVGTYRLSTSEAAFTFPVSAVSGTTITVASPGNTLVVGETFTLNSNPYVITGLGTGTGLAGTYIVNTASGLATGTATSTGIGSSSAPATIFASSAFYYSALPSNNPAGGVVTARAANFPGDFTSIIGASVNSITPIRASWGGALGNFAMLPGVLPTAATTATGTPDLASICTKATDIQAYAQAKSLKVQSLYRLNDPGIWADSGNATITGYITNSSGTNATLNIVSTPYGSLALALGTETAKLTGVGLPVASPVTIPLTTSTSSTYAITPNTTVALGSVGSPVTFAVGAFAPALPIQSNTMKGWIDTASGISTLHVTSLDDGTTHSGFASFTGTLGTSFTARIDDGGAANANPGHVLTVTSPGGSVPQNAYIGVGTLVCPAVGSSAFTCAAVVSLGTGVGYQGTYNLDPGVAAQNITSQVMYGSGQLPGPATSLQATSFTVGTTISPGMVVTDGGASLTGAPLFVTNAGACTVCTVAGNYYPPISADATMRATLTTLVPGEYIQNSTAATPIVNPVKVLSYSGACGISGAYNGGPGCYTLSANPNASGGVGASGSTVVFTGTTITDGGAIAPGPALTIRDQGPFITFPLTNIPAKTGTIALSGAYDVPTIGGTPSGIQVLVSNTANGPPLAGCTPCNWGALTGTISGGKWSGTIAGIPGGGPYIVSVRAANGTAYATLPNSVKVGWVFALWGQGQADAIQGAQSGSYTSWFAGLWGYGGWNGPFAGTGHYDQGPPITANFVPGQPINYAGDRFGVTSGGIPLSEAYSAFDQELFNSFGVPATFLSATRDGIGIGMATLGNVAQTQTVDVGDGSTLSFCSASKFCATSGVSPAGTLVFGAASLTGGWFTGASISGTTFSAGTRLGGALEPGMVLNTPNAPKLLMCLTGCSSQMSFGGSTWLLSNALDSGATPTRADPVGGAPWPNENLQLQVSAVVYGFTGFGTPLVKAGTFAIIDTDPVTNIATMVCQDSQTFAYNQTGGNCTGANVASSFVNYQTGDYLITFSAGHAPLSGHAITASWTNIVTPDQSLSTLNRPQPLDFFGDGTPQSGADSALFNKAPGGVNGHIYAGLGTDHVYMLNSSGGPNTGYQFGALGYSQMISWLYDTKFPALVPGASANVSLLCTGQWRVEGPVAFGNPNDILDGSYDQWAEDACTQSIISGQIASSVLTLNADTTYPMWEGEVLNCAPVTANCTNGPLSGVYITSLISGAWGKNGSTYALAGSPANVSVTSTMQNPVYYSGQGGAYYVGTLNDISVQSQGLLGTIGRNPHTTDGFAGGRRATSRWAAMIYCHNGGNCDDPKLSRANDSAAGTPSPAFDYTNTYAASASGTISGSTVTFTGGLSANSRPFVDGQVISCAGCTAGRVITSVSLPPTQSTASGAGQIGQTFTVTASGSLGVSTTETVTAGCTPGSGGSNCINVNIAINVSGANAIDTCGANNLNGNAPNYVVPNGKCQGNGIGEIVRAFRIGTTQASYGAGGIPNPTPGSVWDDGVDIANGAFNQSAAFTCNIVGAKVVQCVKGPVYSSGAFSSVGQWPSGSTYISYGDVDLVSGRIASLLGYVGGQSFPFTAGSGYTNGTTQPTVTCSTIQSGGNVPKFDVTVSGGAIVNVVPSAATSGAPGLGIGSTCTVALPSGGTGGAIATIPVAPPEGFGGIATYNTDSNTMGMFLYDNSGEPGNPLNPFFTNGQGGYFEPGLPLRPFGNFQGAAVSG